MRAPVVESVEGGPLEGSKGELIEGLKGLHLEEWRSELNGLESTIKRVEGVITGMVEIHHWKS